MRTIDRINKLNRYRPYFWVAGIIGAIIFSRFIASDSFDNIVFPVYIQVAFAIISVVGMIAIVYLGYILGKKIDHN